VLDRCIEWVWKTLLNTDGHRETELRLANEDKLRVPLLRTLARIGSREFEFLCIPVSALARKWLHFLLRRIVTSTVQTTAAWPFLRDKSTQITGEQRGLDIVSEIIRLETVHHAFESTTRRAVPKHQQTHTHSLFRQLANSFVPPRADQEAISKTEGSHPTAGASRRVGVTATRDALHDYGFRDFDWAKSGASRDAKAAGRRVVHDVKDLKHADPGDKFEQDMVHTFVDQDIYIDDFAPFAGSNMIVVTPHYHKLSGHGTNSVWWYHVDANGLPVVSERVTGFNGATYSNQRPWNHTKHDFMYIEHPGRVAFTTYDVQVQFQAGSHHMWVWYARSETVTLSRAVCDLMREAINQKPLASVPLTKADNVVVVQGKTTLKQDMYLLGRFGVPENPVYSIKAACDEGPDTSVEMSENVYKHFNLMGANRPKGYGVNDTKRSLQMQSLWRDSCIEPLMVSFFCISIEFRPQPNILYSRRDGSVDEDVVEVMNAVEAAPNAFGGAPGVADTKSPAAAMAYKEKRLEAYANTVTPPDSMLGVMAMLLERFISLVSRESGHQRDSLRLCEPLVICERRIKAVQAARLQTNAELLAEPGQNRTFLKHEVAAKASVAPRGITQLNEPASIATGRVGLLIKELLRDCAFFTPGSTPMEIAAAIRLLAEMAMGAAERGESAEHTVSGAHDTDYTKMDETISEFIYNQLFVKFVLAFVDDRDKAEVSDILAANVNIKTVLDGKTITVGYKNNSGSGVTTELNTIVSAFVEYCITCYAICMYVWRVKHQQGLVTGTLQFDQIKKNTVKKALEQYSKMHSFHDIGRGSWMYRSTPDGPQLDMYSIPYAVIGPKCGDDGVAPHLPKITDAVWEAAAKYVTSSIGMIVKVTFSNPENGKYYLGRHFPRPLESLASYADVITSCRKLSVAKGLDIEKFKLKVFGYWTTDHNTPGIREYLIVVANIFGFQLRKFTDIVELDSQSGGMVLTPEMAKLLANDSDMFYRCAAGPYPFEEGDEGMMFEAIAPQLGFTPAEMQAWLEDMAKCTTREELDEFQIPGADYDPDAEPEGTVRVAGPVANLLSTFVGPDHAKHGVWVSGTSFGELVAASTIALEECLVARDA